MHLKRTFPGLFTNLLLFIVLLPPSAVSGKELFRDDFTSALKTQWRVVDQAATDASAWTVNGGVLREVTSASPDSATQPGSYLMTGDATWTDYRVSARMRSAAPRGVMGLVFGYRDAGNYYQLLIEGRGGRRLIKVVNSLTTVLARDSVNCRKNTWYAIEATMSGGTVAVRIDGKRIFQVSDVSHNAGGVGLYSSSDAGAEFDAVSVTTGGVMPLAIGQESLLTDDFDSGLTGQWSPVDEGGTGGQQSDWRVTDGVLEQKSSTIPVTYLLTGNLRWTSYSASVQMQSLTTGVIGLVFGYQSTGNYYRFTMDAQKRQLAKLVDGSATVLDEDETPMQAGQFYAVEARLDGGQVEIWIDSTKLLEAADTTFTSGQIGLYTEANPDAQFDAVQVTGTMGPCQYSINPSSAPAGAAGTTGSIAVTTTPGCEWTAASNAGWLSVTSGATGSGSGTVGFSVQASNIITSRQGTLTVAGQTFTVTQDAAPCTYSITPTSRAINPGAGTGQVALTTLAGCPWTAASNMPWLVISSAMTGKGSAKINYTIKANNSGVQRVATLTIAGQVFTITQSSQSSCTFAVAPTVITLSPSTNSANVSVTTTTGCAWTSVSNAAWITVTAGKSATGNGKAAFSVSANPEAASRTGTLTIAGTTVEVTQFAVGVPAVHYVPATGSLQLAIDQAMPGDTIALQPGAVYKGNFFLRKKTGNEFITITTADANSLPASGTRITPAYASVLPKIVSPSNSPVIRTDDGAHHYRLVGLEIQSPGWYGWDLIRLGSETATDVSQQASDIELDRLYIHGDPKLGAKRGVALNSSSTIIRNCYISDIKGIGQETQAIGGWNGPGPYEITNNYLEAAGENIMFGGATASINGIIPSDIQIKRNHFYKRLSWRKGDPTYAGKLWTVKNLLELKNARRVTVEGNVFENNWLQAQAGYAIVLTVRTQSRAMPWALVEDVTFVKNIIRHSGSGVNILGKDDNGGSLGSGRRMVIKDNIFEDIDYKKWGGEGRLFQILHGAEDVTVDHNTVVSNNAKIALSLSGEPLVNFVFTNNILPNGIGGVVGTGTATPTAALNRFAPGYQFTKNVWVAGGKPSAFPAGNLFAANLAAVGFVDPTASDYHLGQTSPYVGIATDGGNAGADVDAVNTATAGVVLP